MSSLNRVYIMGTLSRTPTLQSARNGKAFCRLNVATDNFFTTEDEDKKTTDWQTAINKDGTGSFIQLIDTAGWKSTVINQYNIHSIPANFLLDKNGKIIEKDLRGKEVIAQLTKILAQQ